MTRRETVRTIEGSIGQRRGGRCATPASLFIMIVLTFSLVSFVLIGIPLWRICSRAGFHPALSLLTLIPYLGPLIIAGILGLSDWPKFKHLQKPGA